MKIISFFFFGLALLLFLFSAITLLGWIINVNSFIVFASILAGAIISMFLGAYFASYSKSEYIYIEKTSVNKKEIPKKRGPKKKVFINKNFNIIYKSSNNEISEREITLIYLKPQNDYYELGSFCYLKNAERTFLSERINRLVDSETGEEINNAFQYFDKLYKSLY